MPNATSFLSSIDKKHILFIGPQPDGLVQKLKAKQFKCQLQPDPFLAYVQCLSEVYAGKPRPFAIICREDLPNEEGYSFIKNLQSCPHLKAVPCILYRPSSGPVPIKKAKQAGADDFYCGSFPLTDLLDRLSFLNETKPQNLANETTKHFPPSLRISTGKRIFDILFSLFVLLSLSPFLLLIALLIKLESKGPVFYNSERVGTGYRIFKFYKFRSMRLNADKMIQEFTHLNQYKSASNSAFIKIHCDPRVTRLGRFLRKTSLDELPQFINVLKGEMSIVGNRPLPLYEAEKITKDLWSKRFLAPAGITGLWQVTKRGKKEISEEERIALDMAYADECNSLWYDIKIMAQTFPALIQKEPV